MNSYIPHISKIQKPFQILFRKLFYIFFLTCNLQLVTCNLFAQPTQQWVQRYNRGSGSSSGRSVKLDSSGNVYVLINAPTDTTFGDYGLLKYNNLGNLIWSVFITARVILMILLSNLWLLRQVIFT
jgi:hypothetical protein